MKTLHKLKQKALLLLLLMAAGAAKAQTHLERERLWEDLPLENTAWVHFYQSLMVDSTYFQIGIKGDTMVNGESYKKVFNCSHLGFPIEGECFGGIRGDGNGKWYYRSFIPYGYDSPWPLDLLGEGIETEFLLYDFSLSECDTFFYNGDDYLMNYPRRVFQIEETEINGSMKKTLWFDDDCEEGNHYYDYKWIEGIGSNHGLLFSIQIIPLNGSQFHLVEILQDGEPIYTDPEFEGLDYTSTIELSQVSVLLYPNPITDIGVLDFGNSDKAESLVIIALDGRIVRKENVKGLPSFTVRKDDIGSGAFIYRLTGEHMSTITGKIIIH